MTSSPAGSGLKVVGKAKHLNRLIVFPCGPRHLGDDGLSEVRLEVERASASVFHAGGCTGGMDRPLAGFPTRAGEECGGSN